MSSSNLVSVTYTKEVDGYGVRPPLLSAVVLQSVRMTSESLSGTPTTTESTELRTDRMSAGQVATGLDVGGAVNFELASDKFFNDWFEAGMLDTWTPDETLNTTCDLVPDGTDDQKAVLTLGAEFTNLVPGVLVKFTPTGYARPVVVQVTTVDTPSTVFTVATKRGEPGVSETLDVILPAYVDVNDIVTSLLVGKAYEDVLTDATSDEKSQTYSGELVSGFTINVAYGEIITGNYDTLGNGYAQESPSLQQQVESAGGQVNAAGTTAQLNASLDVPLVTVDDIATDFCTESLTIALSNGLTPQNCVGKAAPQDYTLGTANITFSMTVYNSQTAYDALMPYKITQNPRSFTYVAYNDDGGYAFHLEAIQLSFPDPDASGQNEDTMISAEGTGKVGAAGESAMRIYQI